MIYCVYTLYMDTYVLAHLSLRPKWTFLIEMYPLRRCRHLWWRCKLYTFSTIPISTKVGKKKSFGDLELSLFNWRTTLFSSKSETIKTSWKYTDNFFNRTAEPVSTKLTGNIKHPWVNGVEFEQMKNNFFSKRRQWLLVFLASVLVSLVSLKLVNYQEMVSEVSNVAQRPLFHPIPLSLKTI